MRTVCAWWLYGESWSWSGSSCGLGLLPGHTGSCHLVRAGLKPGGLELKVWPPQACPKPLPWQRVRAEVESDVGWGLCWSSLGGPAREPSAVHWAASVWDSEQARSCTYPLGAGFQSPTASGYPSGKPCWFSKPAMRTCLPGASPQGCDAECGAQAPRSLGRTSAFEWF